MRYVSSLIVAAALILSVAPSVQNARAAEESSSTLIDDLLRCYGIEEAGQRTECYDRVVKPLAGLEADNLDEDKTAPEVLFRFAGSNDGDTQSFEVEQEWQIVWQAEGRLLTIELRTPDNAFLDTLGQQIGGGTGRSDVLRPGSYMLSMRGIGDWQIRVIKAGAGKASNAD
jgi:hypothetical protein